MINFVNVSLILENRRKYSAFCACEPVCVCERERDRETERDIESISAYLVLEVILACFLTA